MDDQDNKTGSGVQSPAPVAGDEWTPWTGGPRPHPPATYVRVRYRDGTEDEGQSAFARWWHDEAEPERDIIAFRLSRPASDVAGGVEREAVEVVEDAIYRHVGEDHRGDLYGTKDAAEDILAALFPASDQPVEASGAGREEEIPERAEGRLAERPWRVGDPLPAVGSVVLVSGVHGDIESDQHRGYLRRTVIGYGKDNAFICLQTEGCWPTVERTTNCWFAALSPASPARTPMGGRVDGHGGVTWPAASADLAREEGFESVDMLVDKARIGVNLMERLPEGYAYSDCPTEIVTDLQNKLDEAKTPMGGEVEALREALECVEDYDHTGRLAGVLRQAIDGAVRIDHLTPDQQSDIRAHITGLSDPEEDTYQAPEHGWTCFHCGATFKTTRGARMHFGHNVTGRPKCHDPERLVEIYDGAEAAVAAASPARADFEVRVARRDEARNAIIAALAAPTPMGGEVEALREAASGVADALHDAAHVKTRNLEAAITNLADLKVIAFKAATALREALAASSPSPAQGGESGHVGTIEVLENLLRSGGETWLNSEQEWALKSAIAALSASPQPEAGEASAYRVRPLKDDPEEWRLLHPEQALGFIDRKGWETQPLYTRAAPPSVQPVEGK